MEKPDRSAASVEKLFIVIRSTLLIFPDMRVGQLIDNALHFGGYDSSDVFNLENDVLAHLVWDFGNKRGKLP